MPPSSATPPPLPDPRSLAYFVPPPPIGWAVVGMYSAAEWHTARTVLGRRNIIARMGNSVDDTGRTIELLVPVGNAEYARSLLEGGIHSVAGVGQAPEGFPISVVTENPSETSIPFANPVDPGLSPRQILTYNIVLVFLVLVLILVVILTGLAFLLPRY